MPSSGLLHNGTHMSHTDPETHTYTLLKVNLFKYFGGIHTYNLSRKMQECYPESEASLE